MSELVEQELPAAISFYIPDRYHKRIIGIGGHHIQSIMRKHSVFVKFSNAMDDAAYLVDRLRAEADANGFRVLGPAPAPLGKLRGEYRAQLLIKGTNRRRMREALVAAIAARPDLQRRVVVDVDPVSVL